MNDDLLFQWKFLQTEEVYVNTYSKSHLLDSTMKDTMESKEFIMMYLI